MNPPYSPPIGQLSFRLFDDIHHGNLWWATVFRLANFAPSKNFAIFLAATGLGIVDARASRTDHRAFNGVRPITHFVNLTLN